MRNGVRRVSLVGVFAAVGVAAAGCGAHGPRKASPAVATTIEGTVGPGFTIALKKGDAPVTTLAAGTYSLRVDDEASIHNFHLVGPGVDVSTAVDFVGKMSFTITITLQPGTYRFVCDPHRALMHGRFVVS